MSNNPKEEIKIKMIAMKLEIIDIGKAAEYYIFDKFNKNEIKDIENCLICQNCGRETRSFVKQRSTGLWCVNCEMILYEAPKKKILKKSETEDFFALTEEDFEFLRKNRIKI